MINDSKIVAKARLLEAQGIAYAVATVVRCKSPTSAKPGYKALITAEGDIYGWIGGGCAQPAVIKTARKVLQDGQPQLIRVSPKDNEQTEEDLVDFNSACYSGGTLDLFIEPVLAQPALLLFGASEVSQSLATLAHFAGFVVTVLSPEAQEADFPWAHQIIDSFDPGDADFPPDPMVVVATQGKGDQAALKAALTIETFHRSFIASARKADKLKQILKDKGHDPGAVDAIVAPAGLAIGANTPEEIAVSVLAALIAVRHEARDAPVTAVVASANRSPAASEETPRQRPPQEARTSSADTGCCGGNTAV